MVPEAKAKNFNSAVLLTKVYFLQAKNGVRDIGTTLKFMLIIQFNSLGVRKSHRITDN